MIRQFLAILIISCLVSCVAMTPIPVAGDLEMDFPIEDPDNLSEGTIERHSIEMSVGASMDIDESFTTGLTFGIRGSDYYSARFSDSNEIWFSENKRDGNTLNMTGRINHNLRYYLNGWEYNSPFAEIRSNIVEGPFAGGSDNLKTKVGFNITNIKLGYEWDNGTAIFLDKKIGKSSFEKHYEYNFANYLSLGLRFAILPGGTLRDQ